MLPSSCTVSTGGAHRLTIASRIIKSRKSAGPICLEASLPRCSTIRLPMRGDAPGTRDEHLQACFLALTHSLLPEKVPNRGTAAQPIPGVPVLNNCAILGARKRDLTQI